MAQGMPWWGLAALILCGVLTGSVVFLTMQIGLWLARKDRGPQR